MAIAKTIQCRAFSAMHWTQERIAQAKGFTQQLVSFRVKLTELPEKVKEYFTKKEFLKEGHALELLQLLNFSNLTPWPSGCQVNYN